MEQEQTPDEQLLSLVARLIARFKGYVSIEEVSDPSEAETTLYEGCVGSQDEIQEVSDPSETDDVINGGFVTMNRFVALTILLLWIAWSFIGVIEFLITGSTTLLLLLQALMSKPVHLALEYYLWHE